MTLDRFIELTEVEHNGTEHYVSFIAKSTKQRVGVYVSDASSDFESKEIAFLWLKEQIKSKNE